MLQWPLLASATLIVGLGMSVGVGLSVLADRWVRPRARWVEIMRGLLPNVGAAMTAGALVWIGLLANVQLRDIDTASGAVQEEAAALRALGALRAQLQPPAAQALDASLRAYVDAARQFEWPRMVEGPSVRAEAAAAALAALPQRALRSEAAELRQGIDTALRDLAQARQKRLAIAVDRIPYVVWVALVCSVVIVLGVSALTHAGQAHGAGRIMGALLGALFGIQLFTVVVVDQPFAGRVAISPAPLVQALAGGVVP